MHNDSRQRDARMMNAVAGLGGRSALSGEIDLRLGIEPRVPPVKLAWIVPLLGRVMGLRDRARPSQASARRATQE
jgi:hypothetical protein